MSWPEALVVLGFLAVLALAIIRATTPEPPDPTPGEMSKWYPDPEEDEDEKTP